MLWTLGAPRATPLLTPRARRKVKCGRILRPASAPRASSVTLWTLGAPQALDWMPRAPLTMVTSFGRINHDDRRLLDNPPRPPGACAGAGSGIRGLRRVYRRGHAPAYRARAGGTEGGQDRGRATGLASYYHDGARARRRRLTMETYSC